jgi:hypothetical protein
MIAAFTNQVSGEAGAAHTLSAYPVLTCAIHSRFEANAMRGPDPAGWRSSREAALARPRPDCRSQAKGALML